MATMKAITFTDFGPSTVLRYDDVEVPEPAPGEVRVRLTASGLNPTDWKSRARHIHGSPTAVKTPHHDGVGTIDAVGDQVDAGRIGQRVWIFFAGSEYRGTAAQWTTVPSDHAIPLDEAVGDDIGASLGMPALTAYRALGDLSLLRGRTVLVNGFGAVGFAALQLARWAGARVICSSTSPEKRDAALALGADGVVDFADPDAPRTLSRLLPGGAVRIVEPALGSNLANDLAALARGGAIGVYATEGSQVAEFPPRAFMNLDARIEFISVFGASAAQVSEMTRDITRALSEDFLTGYPIRRYPLERTAEAHDAAASGAFAKFVIDIP